MSICDGSEMYLLNITIQMELMTNSFVSLYVLGLTTGNLSIVKKMLQYEQRLVH